MKSKNAILLVAVTAFVSFMTLFAQRLEALDSNKVYSCKEVVALLKKSPQRLKGQHIKLKAYYVTEIATIGCDQTCMLIDKEDKAKYKEVSDRQYPSGTGKVSKEAQAALDNFPVVYTAPCTRMGTGPQASMPTSHHPGVYGIYLGHFFDSALEKFCPGKSNYFMIEKQLEEILPTGPAPFLETTVNSGALICEGVGVQPPIHVVLKDRFLLVNGVQYLPNPGEKPYIHDRIDEVRKKQYESLVSDLQRNRFIMFAGRRIEHNNPTTPPNVIMTVDSIVKSSKPVAAKRSEIAKLLEFGKFDDVLLDSIMKNWRVATDK